MLARTLSAVALVLLLTPPGAAGEVSVTGVHLCCAACVKAVDAALKDVEGVRNVRADRKTKTVRFAAADDKAAGAAIAALAKAGFHGTARHGETALPFPESGAEEGATSSRIQIRHVHLCCVACERAVNEAVSKVPGVHAVSAERETSSVEVTGDEFGVAAVVEALNSAGFHAAVE